MKSSEIYAGDSLKAADLKGDTRFRISDWEQRKFQDKNGKITDKLVLHFDRCSDPKLADKNLVVNKTNWKKIYTSYGDETEEWVGKTIVLYPTETEFGGETVPAIRVKIPKAAEAPKPAPQTHDELDPPDDDIPFDP